MPETDSKIPGNIEGDRQDGSRYDRQICQDFRHTGNLLDLFLQNAEVEGKVDTKQDHKRSDDALLQHRIACTPITFIENPPVPAVPNVMQRVSNSGILLINSKMI